MRPFHSFLCSLCVGAGIVLCSPASADLGAAEAAIRARDYEAAIAQLAPLADGGDSYAAWKLAELYLAGHGGTVETGLSLLRSAADAGEPDAQARLGVLHARGEGVAQDDVAAFQWLTLARRGMGPGQNLVLAETNLAVVSRRLTPEQRASALAAAGQTATTYLPEPEQDEAAAPEPADAAPAPSQTELAPVAASYRVQLASVRDPADIEAEWARLTKRIGAPLAGLQLHVQEVDLGTQGIYHRLQAGPFASRGDAADTCASIKSTGADCLVVAP